MNMLLNIVTNRASQIVAFGGAVLVALQEFGVPLTDAQMAAVSGVLLAGVGLLAGRDISRAQKQIPPSS